MKISRHPDQVDTILDSPAVASAALKCNGRAGLGRTGTSLGLTSCVVLVEVGVETLVAELDNFVGFVASNVLHEELEVGLKQQQQQNMKKTLKTSQIHVNKNINMNVTHTPQTSPTSSHSPTRTGRS